MAFEAIKAKAAEADKAENQSKSRDRGAIYRSGFNPNTLGRKGGYDPVGRFQESRGYSYVRAMAVAKGYCQPELAKEEVETSVFLKQQYASAGWSTALGAGGMLAVGSSRLIPTARPGGQEWFEMKAFQREISQKIFAGCNQDLDFDHPEVQTWMTRKALTEASLKTLTSTNLTGAASFIPAPAQGEMIELQRNFEAFSRAGSRDVPLPPQGRVSYPKQVGGSTAYWVGDPNSGITESDLTSGYLYLEAKLLGVLTNVSDQLMRFSDPAIEALIRYDQAMQAGLAADTAMFTGTGGERIKGLLTYDTATTWTQGTDKVLLLTATTTGNDGNTIEPQDLIKMSQILPDPVQQLPKTYIIPTALSQFIMSRRAGAASATDQAGPFVINLNRDPALPLPNTYYGNAVVTSYNVPQNRVKGNGSNLTLIICGAFSDWLIGRSGVVEFDTNPYSNFNKVQTQLRTILYIDAGPRHLASFSYIDTLLPTT